MFYFLISLFSLSTIIILHEVGHFLLARRSGVKIEEFGLGYPPRIFSFKKNDVVYSINAIPFGGFVRILEHNGPDSFSSKSLSKRSLILLAGVINNILIAFLLFTILFSVGMPTFALPKSYKQDVPSMITIREIEKDSPAFLAGLESGDIILGIEHLDYYDVETIENVQNMTKEFQGQEIQLIIKRG
ncbi:MAG: site-2 protease family protein, partial [Candidatus Pacebacteria bacterium]|nr:site-2 protease family protein [Candidatus Paceibacterota bacterium]